MDALATEGQMICENICEPKSMGKCLCATHDSEGGIGVSNAAPREWVWTSCCICGTGTEAANCICKFTIRCECSGSTSDGDDCCQTKDVFSCACQCGSGTCEFRLRKCKCCQVIRTELGTTKIGEREPLKYS